MTILFYPAAINHTFYFDILLDLNKYYNLLSPHCNIQDNVCQCTSESKLLEVEGKNHAVILIIVQTSYEMARGGVEHVFIYICSVNYGHFT